MTVKKEIASLAVGLKLSLWPIAANDSQFSIVRSFPVSNCLNGKKAFNGRLEVHLTLTVKDFGVSTCIRREQGVLVGIVRLEGKGPRNYARHELLETV